MSADVAILTARAAAPPIGSGKSALYHKSSDDSLRWRRANGTEVNLSALGTLTDILGAVYPVGSIYTATVSTDPATLFGFGTWVRFGQGRMLVSQNGSDTDFDTAEETGGAKTHTLTEAELATHTHTQNSHNHTQDSHNHTQDSHGHAVNGNTASLNVGTSWAPGAGTTRGVLTATDGATATNQATTATNQATTATNQNTGSSTPFNIMNPYIVVYMWKRTA